MDLGDGPGPADADGSLGRQPEAGRAVPGLRTPANDRRPDGVDDGRRGGLEQGAGSLGRMLGATAEAGSERTAASPRPNGARIRSSRPSSRAIWRFPTGCSVRSRKWKGLDEAARQKLRFATKSFVDAMSAEQFRADQPAGDEADDRDQGRKSARRPQEHARRHHAGAVDADQDRRVRGRPQPGDHPGQGHLRERSCTS